ncbi:MAG: hypothetical protein P8Y25_10600, partial [Chromatiaceae bacterium]
DDDLFHRVAGVNVHHCSLLQEHENLGKTIERKRDAVDRFREEHDIVTLERDGNVALARLKALTDNLNKARDDVVKYKAQLAAVRAAIARGDPIVPDQEQPGLEALQQKVADLRAKLAELRTRDTEFFLENEPEKRQIPGQSRELEALITETITQGHEQLCEVQRSRERAGPPAEDVQPSGVPGGRHGGAG